MHFDNPITSRIPIKIPNSDALFPLVFWANNNSDDINKQFMLKLVNYYILELYFPIHLKEKEINILQYVEKDLEEVLKGKDLEQFPDEQKEKIVMELYSRWANPNSEIQKRMSLFKERSPDILKPILESR